MTDYIQRYCERRIGRLGKRGTFILISFIYSLSIITLYYGFTANKLCSTPLKVNTFAEQNVNIELDQVEVNREIQTSKPNMINFLRQSDTFIRILSDCLQNDECNVFYLHIGKTGGTTVEARMFSAFPFDDTNTCCGKSHMNRFYERKEIYCQAKFTSYQVSSRHFQEVIHNCMNFKKQQAMNTTSSSSPQAVALISIREAASRAVSYIDQMCNKYFETRDLEVRKACKYCNYEKGSKFAEVFDTVTRKTNSRYQSIMDLTKISIPNVEMMLFDMIDIDSIFTMLENRMDNHSFPLHLKKNEKSTAICNFGMKSEMFKSLALGQEIYRNLTAGM